MIKSMQHALEVQTRRAALGKYGFAHAVRRLIRRAGVVPIDRFPVNVKAKRS